ncbi:hypothetical protein KJ673_02785, partial [Patescibacteria group bacterium]|nr:hypothetical protein [Patescibacteria group bacterium]MCG2687814.1 hypothetical protein [Candidatus Parcubacteria bacterium]
SFGDHEVWRKHAIAYDLMGIIYRKGEVWAFELSSDDDEREPIERASYINDDEIIAQSDIDRLLKIKASNGLEEYGCGNINGVPSIIKVAEVRGQGPDKKWYRRTGDGWIGEGWE